MAHTNTATKTPKASKTKATPVTMAEVQAVAVATAIAPPVSAEALILAAKAAQEAKAAQDKADAVAALATAVGNLEASKVAIALQWIQHDKESRSWLTLAGEKISHFVADYCVLHGLAKRNDAVNEVCDAIALGTSDDYSQDASRCIAVYHAGKVFGGSIARLPINAQRGAALLVERVASEDGRSEVWILAPDIADRAHTIIALATTDVPTAPSHVRARIRRVKGGWGNGIDIYNLARDLNNFRRALKGAADPFVFVADEGKDKGKDAAPPATGEVAKIVTTSTGEVAKVVSTTTAPTVSETAILAPTVRGEQDATAMRPDGTNGADAAVKLDSKPAIAAAQILEALSGMGDDDASGQPLAALTLRKLAANEEGCTFDGFFLPLIDGLALAGRMNVLHKMGLRIAREAKIATYLKANADASRDDAIKATDAKK